jgi:hypothetical protein
MVTGGANPGYKGAVMWNPLGTKVCKKCGERKPLKGGKQSRDGYGFLCAGCKKP